ncbi:hypothetical protein TWF569_004969 [Orbilia oligospora]|uniref:F-box domain-containing protein n=1 Tax=Orbilia oligospora TaxID=2813651 RepID=A0A7C8NJI8_ORBOL|nr:hypothetical protein TWF103_003680 [Orbilia oligospora]KAF3089250.1 hypothetical protein TWF102_009740 [Orbilia oligospora]KAF3090277.1 hypothetical protein TWF706_009912 [Orbilia oligospora]KAF3126719.1 hypothetical protein TWF594_000851 [Orbilia oligospora]KAF3149797.1 hypothetical protein TWF569_004969 [Orbilia oligospora]
MAAAFECIPVEICLQIFSYLELSSLLNLRLSSRLLLSAASSNGIWQSKCIRKWQNHAAMMDVLALRPTNLAFSESPRGWFRAYIHIQRAVYSNWLLNENDISGSMWLLWFRHTLTGVGVGNQQYHAVIEWTPDKTVRPVSGLPLRTSPNWEVVSNGGKGVKVPAYPKYHPSRDRVTWLRTLETHNEYMVADSPEFLRTILELDFTIRNELSLPIPDSLTEQIDSIIAQRNDEYLPRLSGHYREALGNLDASQGTRSILLEEGNNTIGVSTISAISSSSDAGSESDAGSSGSASAWPYGDTSIYPFTLALRPVKNRSPPRLCEHIVTTQSWPAKDP